MMVALLSVDTDRPPRPEAYACSCVCDCIFCIFFFSRRGSLVSSRVRGWGGRGGGAVPSLPPALSVCLPGAAIVVSSIDTIIVMMMMIMIIVNVMS